MLKEVGIFFAASQALELQPIRPNDIFECTVCKERDSMAAASQLDRDPDERVNVSRSPKRNQQDVLRFCHALMTLRLQDIRACVSCFIGCLIAEARGFMGKTYRKLDRQQGARPSSAQMSESLKWVETRKSRIHGRGVFARRDIPAGTRLIEYVGLPISKKKSDELCLQQNSYVFTVSAASDIDGKVSWNPARLMNHSCEPNCEANVDESDRIWIFSIRSIARAEELTFNYGYSLEDFMKFPCRCGAPSCVGYMVSEELIPVVRGLLGK